MKFNNPFMFALPKRPTTRAQVAAAAAHIAETFGVVGTVRVVSIEDTFILCEVRS